MKKYRKKKKSLDTEVIFKLYKRVPSTIYVGKKEFTIKQFIYNGG